MKNANGNKFANKQKTEYGTYRIVSKVTKLSLNRWGCCVCVFLVGGGCKEAVGFTRPK